MKSDVFYLRSVTPAIRLDDLPAMATHAQGCFGLHRVEWRMSFLSLDGSEMLCWYRAPDTESVRIALRTLGANMHGVWPGRLESLSASSSSDALTDVSVLAVVPVSFSQELAGRVVDVVRSRGGELVSQISSLDGSRSIWLFRAAEVDHVAEAFSTRKMRDVRVWACRGFSPNLDSSQEAK